MAYLRYVWQNHKLEYATDKTMISSFITGPNESMGNPGSYWHRAYCTGHCCGKDATVEKNETTCLEHINGLFIQSRYNPCDVLMRPLWKCWLVIRESADARPDVFIRCSENSISVR